MELPSTHGIKQYVKTFVLKDLAAVEREKSYSELASNTLIEASSQTDTKLFGEPFLCLFPPYLQCSIQGGTWKRTTLAPSRGKGGWTVGVIMKRKQAGGDCHGGGSGGGGGGGGGFGSPPLGFIPPQLIPSIN